MSTLSSRDSSGKEQYYTRPEVADLCVQTALPFIKAGDTLVEPCAGTGEFVKAMRRAGLTNPITSADIEPKYSGVVKADFLNTPAVGDFFLTNPPYGRNNKLSVAFFNHAATSAKYIGFLIPSSWRKWTVEARLDHNFHKVADIDMPDEAFYDEVKGNLGGMLSTCFQVWEKRDYLRKDTVVPDLGYLSVSTKEKANVVFVYAGYGCGKVLTSFDRTKKNHYLIYSQNYRNIDQYIYSLSAASSNEVWDSITSCTINNWCVCSVFSIFSAYKSRI